MLPCRYERCLSVVQILGGLLCSVAHIARGSAYIPGCIRYGIVLGGFATGKAREEISADGHRHQQHDCDQPATASPLPALNHSGPGLRVPCW